MADNAPVIPGIEASLAKALTGIEIPPRPALLDKVMAEMQEEEPDFRRLANLILADVGLAAGLIKTANAPAFGYRSKATTVRDALTMLGLINVLRTLAGLSLRNSLPETPALKGFWESSTRVALLCGWLARELGVHDGIRSEDAYTYALFHDCGIPVMLKALPGYEQTLALASRDVERPFTETETGRHGLNHALVGCAMAQSWYLPEVHVQAILNHHNSAIRSEQAPDLPHGSRRLVALGQLAEKLHSEHSGVADHDWSRMGEACSAILDITPGRIAQLQSDTAEVIKTFE